MSQQKQESHDWENQANRMKTTMNVSRPESDMGDLLEGRPGPRRKVSLLHVASQEIFRTDIPVRSMRSRRRCMNLMDDSEAILRCEDLQKTSKAAAQYP